MEAGATSRQDPTPILQRAIALEAEGKNFEAVRSYQEAAELGSREALERLVWIHRCGWLGVKDEPWVARKWSEIAAARGMHIEPLRRDRSAQCAAAMKEFAALRRNAIPAPRSAPTAKTSSEAESLFRQALSIEAEGRVADAIRIYRRAVRAGSGKAARRLGDIYACGIGGVASDQAESRAWYDTARSLGESMPVSVGRNC